jgi:two-component system OmpR family sensor kinase
VLDQRLAASARMVVSLLESDAAGDLKLQESGALPLGGIACEISSLRGEVLARSGGAPNAGLALPEDGFGEQQVEGETWRVFTVSDGELRVTSAERMAGRTAFMRQVTLGLGLLASLALVWWAVGRALAPLAVLRADLSRRRVTDEAPLSVPEGGVELAPMVDTLNHWLGNARDALMRERRLTDDLAHELRTPLAAIRTQLQVADMTEGERAAHARAQARQAVLRLANNLDQLLALAREEGAESRRREPPEALGDLLATVLEELRPASLEKRLTVRLDADHDRALRRAAPAGPGLMRIALRNVLENAVRHSPAGGEIGVRVESGYNDEDIAVTVEDQGPGLAPDQRARALDRGWRGGGEGQGLGLAIVASVMARTGGAIALDAADSGGLRVTLRWLSSPRPAGSA